MVNFSPKFGAHPCHTILKRKKKNKNLPAI
jgi:hypothetical protein